jgi:glycerophosphoryl diester phosphodiesterase
MADRIDDQLQHLADLFFARRPQPRPEPSKLARARIIAHRGIHDNRTVLENTIPAFTRAVSAGVWGIELDVRWTRDLVPVVVHDPDLTRLHGLDLQIRAVTRAQLSKQCPTVPSLAEIVERFGGRLHLMIEIKELPAAGKGLPGDTLARALAPVAPVRDYHLMSLDAQILEQIDPFPPEARVAIAYYWPGGLSRRAVAASWGGLCAHYLLMRPYLIRKHHRLRQGIGTGYIASRNSLFRELNRGVDWIFSNHADRIQAFLDEARKRPGV